MKRFHPLFFLFLLSPGFIWCQAPGYMGKRMVAGYGAHLNPVTYGSTVNNKSLTGSQRGSSEKGYFRLNFAQELFFEGATSKRSVTGISIKYLETGYDNRASVNEHGTNPSYYYKIKVLTITPYLKSCFRRYLAPWGKYFIVAPVINVIRSEHDAYMNISKTVNGHDTLITDFGPDNKKYLSADLLMGFGNTRVLFNRITLDYGFHFQAISTLAILEPLLDWNPSYDQEEYINGTIKKRVRAANRFNVFIRIGYLF